MAIQNPVIRQMVKSATLLSLFMLMGIGLLLWVAHITQPKIEQAQKDNLIKTFNQIIPHSEYDNDPLNDTLIIKNPKSLALLGTRTPVTFYRLRKNGRSVAVIFPITAPDGYSGPIKLLIGVYRDGRIAGVRVLEERETPGLGDKIELKKSPWILSFNGRRLTPENESRWAVKKDHGMFDQFTGATITPRAVVKAIKHALIFVNQMGDKLYE
ncbi:electron transport complex subunit RsxG [Galenea microaerophila]